MVQTQQQQRESETSDSEYVAMVSEEMKASKEHSAKADTAHQSFKRMMLDRRVNALALTRALLKWANPASDLWLSMKTDGKNTMRNAGETSYAAVYGALYVLFQAVPLTLLE